MQFSNVGRVLCAAVSLTALLCFAPFPAQSSPALQAKAASLNDGLKSQVIEWRRDFHEHPELSNREFRTAAKVAAHLRSLGLSVQTNVAHTGVVGLLKGGSPGPVVALRADMDALPVKERGDLPFASHARSVYNNQEVDVMHACGHDTHVAILMATAQTLSQLRDELPGTVKFIFQPAEEGPPVGEEGGAELMVKEGVMKNPKVDAVFGLHISSKEDVNTIHYRSGGIMASVDDFRILVKGKQAHGSAPWNSIDPIVTSAMIINALQTIVSRSMELTKNAAVVTVGSIHGGVRSNIIPEEVELVGTIRSLDEDMRNTIHERFHRIVNNVAASMGATVEIKLPYSAHYPVTYNDPDLLQKMLPSLQAVAGEENVQLMDAITGAEDFSFLAQEAPGLFFFLGGKTRELPRAEAADHHTPDFFIDESGLQLGVQTLTRLTLDYLTANR